MQWSPQQAQALDAVGAWLRNPGQQIFRLFGFAGVGKSSLARELGDQHNGVTRYAAFTGKAALVMRGKGCAGATTLHSFLYTPSQKSRARLRELEAEFDLLKQGSANATLFEQIKKALADERERLRQPAFTMKPFPLETAQGTIDLVIIDEVSMVGERLAKDLLSLGVKVLVLGDPAQLPPVKGTGYFTNVEPDFMLTEVHRQALDSPVLRLATEVRETGVLREGRYGESRVCPRTELAPEEYAAAEQVLVGMNVTRRGANRRLREMAGFTGDLPQPGEKLVCLRNDHAPDKQLLNGSLWTVIGADDAPSDDTFPLTVESLDDGTSRRVATRCHKYTFLGTPQPDWYAMIRYDADGNAERVSEFDFGYALTTHKAQGSQWNDVVLIDEWRRDDWRRWMYTGLTRAAQRITVVR
jgi:Mesyanzhinovviridae Dda-like helicase